MSPKESEKEIEESIKKENKKESKKEKSNDKDKIEELTDDLQRLQAEFENYKKRIDREKAEYLKYAKESLIEELLPVLDSFEFALKNNTSDKEKLCKGVEMIYAQLFSILEKEGLKPIETKGKDIDPYKHEVLMKVESKEKEDTILEELQKGYTLGEKVIRPSKIKVAK